MADDKYTFKVDAIGNEAGAQVITGKATPVSGAPPIAEDEQLTLVRGDGSTLPPEPPLGVMSPYNSTTEIGKPPLIDNLGKHWSIASDRAVKVDGLPATGGIDGGFADLLLWHSDARIYADAGTAAGGWYVKVPNSWVASSDPRGGNTDPNPHPQMSQYGSTTLPGGAALIDENGVPWKLRADKAVLKNDVVLNPWNAADELLWWNTNKIYAKYANKWYVENASETDFERSSDPRVVTPIPDPPVDPIPPPSGGVRQRRGGWVFPIEWASARIAIDFAKRELYVIGHDQTQELHICDLPTTMGTGAPSTWPKLVIKKTIPKFWHDPADEGSYANSLAFFRGKLWASPKTMYASSPASNGPLTLFALDGETLPLSLPRQKFSGFVKRAGKEPLIGCGGYASGQGSCSGPSLATMDGQRLIEYGWPATPGANLEFWNDRAPREPNYWVEGHGDSWVGWEPRTISGVRVGRWASDNIHGGGLLLPDGLKYWPIMGIGELKYGYQSIGFAAEGNIRTYEYTYQPDAPYAFVSYQMVNMGMVLGQEVAPDGTVYTAERWIAGGNYAAISVWT